jgi:predicted transcriptional regulator
MDDGGKPGLAERMLTRYAEDAARLPLDTLLPAARGSGFDPTALLSLGGGDVALVLRRLASLPREEAAPPFGLAVCDASGALLFRRRLASFSIPRFGPGCPLWPLYAALARPGAAGHGDPRDAGRRAVPRLVGGAAGGADGLWQAPVMQATMLIAPIDAETGQGGAIPIGPGCTLCPIRAAVGAGEPAQKRV